MCKAVLKAYEAYPLTESNRYNHEMNAKRVGYQQGYEQAEKDLELTWEDIKQICDITFEEACRFQRNMKGSHIYKEQHYQEVLKRFKEQRT